MTEDSLEVVDDHSKVADDRPKVADAFPTYEPNRLYLLVVIIMIVGHT